MVLAVCHQLEMNVKHVARDTNNPLLPLFVVLTLTEL